MPPLATIPVTASGVSAANVVATIEVPASHHGTFRPERKKSVVVYRVTDYAGPAARKKLYAELAARGYPLAGIICAAEPIMTKWKWMLAARLRAKVFVVNENVDFFWLDWGHLRMIGHFALFRAG